MKPGARAFLAALLLAPLASFAAETPGASARGIQQQLQALRQTGTVLHVGAHPDDENTELITWLSLGRGCRAAYLSLTRGEGGQNELGKDLDERLGVLRTQELLAARRLDHGRQFFTRAIDFGFSKSPEETLRVWDRQAVLGDIVRVIRQFRPDVIVTRFPIPPGSGGHGQHTASAILTLEAAKLAGDPAAYPEQLAAGLTPWQTRRVLWNSFRFGGAGPGPLDLPAMSQDIAGVDPVSGETFSSIAARSRAMHKTQGLGEFKSRNPTGPNVQNFMILAGDLPAKDLLDGIETNWARYSGGAEIDAALQAIIAGFKPEDPAAAVPALLALRPKLAALPQDALVADKRAALDRLVLDCIGLKIETRADRAEVAAGESLGLATTVSIAPGSVAVDYLGAEIARDAASFRGTGAHVRLSSNAPHSAKLAAQIPADATATHPYWLGEGGSAGVAGVTDASLIGSPDNPPALLMAHGFQIGSERLVVVAEPTFAAPGQPPGSDQRIAIIPPVSLALGSDIYVVAPGAVRQVTIEVTAARAGVAGRLGLEVSPGWTVAPQAQEFRLAASGDKARLTFSLSAPAAGGSGQVAAVAEIAGRRYSTQRRVLDYAHLPVQVLQPRARARLTSFPLATKGFSVGYLPGAGDSVAECMEQMGFVVRRLTGADLKPELLRGLDAVVIGVRAFNERIDLKEAFPGLLAWVEQGGTVIAQYNRPNGLADAALGPYPLSIQGSASQLRVTDENAPVTLLAPDHAVVNTPNRIATGDFAGWVQERGAYFPSQWDEEHYAVILGMSDPGEAPLRSSVLVAKHGRGHYVYTGLAFFRQLPAGVPGAYRLFANLLALGH